LRTPFSYTASTRIPMAPLYAFPRSGSVAVRHDLTLRPARFRAKGDHTSGTCQFLYAPAPPRRSAVGRARGRRHRTGRGNAPSAADRRNRSSTFDDVAGVLPGTPTARSPACRGRNKGTSTISRRTRFDYRTGLRQLLPTELANEALKP
jgi:hypothetical protein